MVATVLALALNTASTLLPATQPGLSADEGVFLQTDADDGGKVNYFIAQGARHAILDDDLQAELRLNPLWPYRVAPRDEVLAFPEGAPLGNATVGRLADQLVADQLVAEDDPAPTADDAADAEQAAPAPKAEQAAPAPDLAELAPDAELAAPAPETILAAPAPGLTYTVQRGDTLFSLAARFGVSMADLLAENPMPNPDRINVGQVLSLG